MKNVVLIPLLASAALLGCQDANHSNTAQAQSAAQSKVAPWIGQYEGTTPCMGCLSHCEDCPGMAVTLALHEDQTYTLTRESLSGHNEIETLKGKLRFMDDAKQKIELVNVATRNLLYVDLDKQQLEIREDQSGKSYQMQSDFLLGKLS